MGKNVLVIYYSQSGQLKKIAEIFTAPFIENGCDVEFFETKLENNFPFPWGGKEFFDAMPESVLGIPAKVVQPKLLKEEYDLIVLAYQPWFLSPSIPATSILHHPAIKYRLHHTPVITLIGSRNMWITAQEKIKVLLEKEKANLVGNIVLSDKHNNFISAVTIQYWMFTGKKNKMWGVFPLPGVSDDDINSVRTFGEVVLPSLQSGNYDGLQNKLVAKKAVDVHTNLMFIEARASVLFKIWATAIRKKTNRSLWLQLFKYYLLFALFIVAPIVLLIYNLFFRPFSGGAISLKKKFYSGVNYNE